MPFKIIFMDCNMPIMDGFTTSKQVVEACNLNNCELPNIIALTANEPTEELVSKCMQSGMQAVGGGYPPWVLARMHTLGGHYVVFVGLLLGGGVWQAAAWLGLYFFVWLGVMGWPL